MTSDEKIATAMLLGGEFINKLPSGGYLCLRPGAAPEAHTYAPTKGIAAERFIRRLGFWCDATDGVVDLRTTVEPNP